MTTPSTDNIFLGAGELYFDRFQNDQSSGERHLGNCSRAELNIQQEKKEKYSNMDKGKRLYKSVSVKTNATVKITMDEYDAANIALALYGAEGTIIQGAGAVTDEVIRLFKDRWVKLPKRFISSVAIKPMANIAAAVGPTAPIGPVVSTGTVTSGGLFSGSNYDSFDVAVTVAPTAAGNIAGGKFKWRKNDGGWSADVAMAAAAALSDGVTVTFASSGSQNFSIGDTWAIACTPAITAYVNGVDFAVSVRDGKLGRVYIPAASRIVDASNCKVSYLYSTGVLPKISAAVQPTIEGLLRFVGDPDSGPAYEGEFWHVQLQNSGDLSLVGEDFGSLSFVAKCLDDSIAHPDDPYFRLVKIS